MIKEKFISAIIGTLFFAVFQPFGMSDFGLVERLLIDCGLFVIAFVSCMTSETITTYVLRMPHPSSNPELVKQNPRYAFNRAIIVLGTSIYAGKPRKKMVEFCAINEVYLLTRRLFLFVCGMDRKKAMEEIEAAYSPALLNHADATTFIDGEFSLARMTFFERLLLRAFFGIKHSETREYGPIIRNFANNIYIKHANY